MASLRNNAGEDQAVSGFHTKNQQLGKTPVTTNLQTPKRIVEVMEDTFIARDLGNHRGASQANDQSKVRQPRHVDTSLTISGGVERAINTRLTPYAQARSF